MKKFSLILMLVMLPFTLMAQTSSPVGEWSPDSKCWIGEIKIKQIGENEYKVRMSTEYDGVKVFSSSFDNGVLYGKYEDESPEYGEFWVGNGPIEKGRKKEILVGESGYRYSSNGAVDGWLGDNAGYRKTNSRSNCATVEKSYVLIRLVFKGDRMTAYKKLRGEYLKYGEPMFYQESSWGNGYEYTKW